MWWGWRPTFHRLMGWWKMATICSGSILGKRNGTTEDAWRVKKNPSSWGPWVFILWEKKTWNLKPEFWGWTWIYGSRVLQKMSWVMACRLAIGQPPEVKSDSPAAWRSSRICDDSLIRFGRQTWALEVWSNMTEVVWKYHTNLNKLVSAFVLFA